MAQQYLLPCSACGAKTPVESRQAGETIVCQCGQSLNVPTLRGLRELETATDTRPVLPAKTKWSPLQGVLFSLGIVAALVGGGFATRHFVIYRSLAEHTVDRTEEVDQNFSALIDKLTISESMDAWSDMVKSGLTRDDVPTWVMARQISATQFRAMVIWAIVGGLGLAAVVAALAMTRTGKPASRS